MQCTIQASPSDISTVRRVCACSNLCSRATFLRLHYNNSFLFSLILGIPYSMILIRLFYGCKMEKITYRIVESDELVIKTFESFGCQAAQLNSLTCPLNTIIRIYSLSKADKTSHTMCSSYPGYTYHLS